MASPIEGTYTLDGMLQGKIPEAAHAKMVESLREWADSASKAGFPFSLEIDGGMFSLLCGSQVQKISAPGIAVADTLRDSINALIESFPPEGRAQLFSTIRSSEYVSGAEVQGLYMIGPDGLIRAQARRVELETTAPEKPLSKSEKIKMLLMAGGIVAVFLVISSFFIDFKKVFGGVQGRMKVLKVQDIEFDVSLYADYVEVTLGELDRRNGGVTVKLKRGPKFSDIGAENLEVGEKGVSWNELLVLSNLKRGFIPVLMHGTDAGVVREGKIPITSLGALEEAPAFITLPRSTRVTRIELAR